MAEPVGLGMSLDDLISRQQQEREGYGKQRRGRQAGGRSSSGDGGGGRGRGRGGRHSGGRDRMEEDWQGGRQQQQQQQRIQQRRGPAGQGQQQHERRGHDAQRPRDPNAYRDEQKCFQRDSGEVVFRFRQTNLVSIDAAGNVTLNSGGHCNGVTLASLNDALNLIGIRVTCPSGDVASGEWSISDGRSLTRFADGVVLPAKGPQHAGRGRQMLQAFNNPHHAQQAAAAAASNAAATAAGILPFTGFVPPGVPAGRVAIVGMAPLQGQAPAAGGAARPSVFARLGGTQPSPQQRFTPY